MNTWLETFIKDLWEYIKSIIIVLIISIIIGIFKYIGLRKKEI